MLFGRVGSFCLNGDVALAICNIALELAGRNEVGATQIARLGELVLGEHSKGLAVVVFEPDRNVRLLRQHEANIQRDPVSLLPGAAG